MHGKSFEFWCCALLFFASSTKPLRNFTIDNKEDNNSMVRYELPVNSTERNGNETVFNGYNLRKNFTLDYEDAQDVFRIENDNEDYIVPHETCDNRTCIRLCCPLGDRYNSSLRNCTVERPKYVFSDVYNFWDETNMQTEYKKIDEMFQLIVQNPCPKLMKFVRINLNDDSLADYKYVFFENGTLYLPYLDQFVDSTSYCLAFLNHDEVIAFTCSQPLTKVVDKKKNYFTTFIKPVINATNIIYMICIIVSLLCMLILFLVYTILPELQNIHGFMLCRYSSMVFILYLNTILQMLIKTKNLAYPICIASACYFWLSVMSIDMWWTFRDFSSLKKKAKPEENNRKKFLYSIIAWGGSFILVIICIIMETVPSVPRSMVRPRFQVSSCWFHFGAADQLYNYVPKIICTVISIILSIQTALKIMRYEKDTTHHLKDAESRCYNENKKWANLYLKLFIMLFIIIAMECIMMTVLEFWVVKDYTNLTITYIVFSIFILEFIKGIGIFILFVCKKTIIQLLLKHFRQNCRYSFKIFTRKGFYNFEHVHQHVKHNYFIGKYQ
ncbi:probable G-protein coupled receptor Mth-like 3 isoform X2 [Anoplolepis gracilipes]|uniref:probable G-protein coupled receptor Mth-like 3 isoform X2 n=1 Tax=Anoplolepis gracilipes TaxID=354296 RepID=UPI003BA255B4